MACAHKHINLSKHTHSSKCFHTLHITQCLHNTCFRCVKFTHLNRFWNVCHVVLNARDKEICNTQCLPLNILQSHLRSMWVKQQSIPVHNAVSRQTRGVGC